MADDAGPPPRRRLGRRPQTTPTPPGEVTRAPDAFDEGRPDADAAYAAAEFEAAEYDAAAEAARVAPGPLLRRRLGRRSMAAPLAGPSGTLESSHDDTDPTEPAAERPTGPEAALASRSPAPWLPMLEDRSPNPAICPFLRGLDDTGSTRPPIERADAANRCAALVEPVPQSVRQQELVCLSAGHVNCPRYLRGAAAATEVPSPAVRAGRTLTPAVLGSIAVVIVAFAASLAFVAARGGLDLTAAATALPSASAVAAGPSVEPTVRPTAVPTVIPTPTPVATQQPTPTPTLAPSPSPTPTPEPTAAPTATPAPTSDRYALLEPCPDTPKCWIYTVRRGDNLFSIANYFGVSLEAIYDRNPWARTQSLRAGLELRLPPPTR